MTDPTPAQLEVMRNPPIEFDAATHTYRRAGELIPSVTEILEPHGAMKYVRREYKEPAADLGRKVHLACHLLDQDLLELGALDPILQPYVQAWIDFKRETRVVIVASERIVHHEKLGYAGTLDRQVYFPRRNLASVLDIKCGQVPKTVGPQTAAYAEADELGIVSNIRYCVQLRPDGTHRLYQLVDSRDWHVFVSALNIWKWQKRTPSYGTDDGNSADH